ncbi:MAG: hypothetical protein QM579_08070 [Desulfovibrio sp.]|uniref:DUF4376 domain-containing protein n=1 Tax=Desulfovibrio sp. TaxID=885 RepID=UPI0039E46DED
MWVLKNDTLVVNVDSETDRDNLLSAGYSLLTSEQIAEAGMVGYEHLVSPVNTVVNADGSIAFTPPAPDPIEQVAARKLTAIDAETSASITAGFDYVINGDSLRFSYDTFDQQNFADSANVAQLVMAGGEGLPADVIWNAYRNSTPDFKGELVRLTFGPADFIALYTAGALAHKATCMERGGQRKVAVSEALARGATAVEIEAI